MSVDAAGSMPVAARAAWPDDDLVQDARGGSMDAFDTLYRRYAGEIEGFIAARVSDAELAADLTSQVFTKAFAALPRYQAGSFRGWLYAIARNAITDAWRRQRPTAPLERAEQMPAVDESPEAQAIRAEASARLHAALAELSSDQQRIVRLRLQGLTGPEIAERLGMHPDAVKSAQYRAFGRLRTILHDLSPAADTSQPLPLPSELPDDPTDPPLFDTAIAGRPRAGSRAGCVGARRHVRPRRARSGNGGDGRPALCLGGCLWGVNPGGASHRGGVSFIQAPNGIRAALAITDPAGVPSRRA
ncbi:MAG: sigma-70 family RNA polymerase sigma factor [Thermomicrobiales bacterium]